MPYICQIANAFCEFFRVIDNDIFIILLLYKKMYLYFIDSCQLLRTVEPAVNAIQIPYD